MEERQWGSDFAEAEKITISNAEARLEKEDVDGDGGKRPHRETVCGLC